MPTTAAPHTVLAPDEGLRLQSGPGRDLIFKVTGEDTAFALDYFIVEVAPHGGPPRHVHHGQEETIHVLKGRFKVRIGDELFQLEQGGVARLPSKLPHASLNLTDEPPRSSSCTPPAAGTSSTKS
jgi:quercetin dioxygenase-like cupin family protein